MHITIKDIVYNGIIAAIYVVLTMVTFPVSFLGIQFRIAEILVLLCFFRKDYAFGLTIGCVLANLFSSLGFIDCVFGGLATLLSCLLIGYCRHLAIAILIPVIVNGFVVGYELYQFLQEPFWISVGTVALGELAVMVVGYAIVFAARHNIKLWELIRRNQNENFKF